MEEDLQQEVASYSYSEREREGESEAVGEDLKDTAVCPSSTSSQYKIAFVATRFSQERCHRYNSTARFVRSIMDLEQHVNIC